MDSELVILHFVSVNAAERALATVRSLEAEGFLQVEEAALLARDAKGVVTAESTDLGKPVRTSALGGVVGLVAGGVIGLPVVGFLAGAGLAAKSSSQADELEELINTVGTRMTNETCVLVLSIASLDDPEMVVDRFRVHDDDLLRSEVPAALKEQLDRYEPTEEG